MIGNDMKYIFLLCLLAVGCTDNPRVVAEKAEVQKLSNEMTPAEGNGGWNTLDEGLVWKFSNTLPFNSTDIVYEGNDWVTFEWQGHRYLYQFGGSHGGHAAI